MGDMDRAMTLAREYRALIERGDVVLAEQARRNLDDLGIGSYMDGRWTLAEPIRRAMGELP